jgi:hypothetical protein
MLAITTNTMNLYNNDSDPRTKQVGKAGSETKSTRREDSTSLGKSSIKLHEFLPDPTEEAEEVGWFPIQ